MAKTKTRSERSMRSKIYDLIYYESLKSKKEEPTITSAQLAKLSRGGAR